MSIGQKGTTSRWFCAEVIVRTDPTQFHFPRVSRLQRQDEELESVTPAGMIEFYMEQHGMSRADLGRLLGDRSVASAILNGRRSPSKNHVRILAERFHAPAELFLPRR